MVLLRRFAALVTLALVTGSGFAQTSSRSANKSTSPAPGAKAATASSATKPAPASAAGGLTDINSASADQLKMLPGIGDAYAKRIVAGRPYTAKNQLTARGVLPQATYDKVQTLIIAKQQPK